MMKKEEATPKVPLEYINRVLSPLHLVIVLISLSFATIFLCSNSNFVTELRTRFPVPCDSDEEQKQQKPMFEKNGAGLRQMQQESNELRSQKRPDKFAWSSELKGWTLERDNLRGSTANNDRGCVWPEDCNSSERFSSGEDRIVNQLRLFGDFDADEGGKSSKSNGDNVKLFKILPPSFSSYPIGQEIFITESCAINRCSITYDKEEADALIFENSDVIDEPPRYRRIDQVWIAYLLESPCHTFDKRFKRLHRGNGHFNWTASYRSDSDLVAPYSKFVPFQDKVGEFNSLVKLSSARRKSTSSSILESHSIEEAKRIFFTNSSANQRSLIGNKQGKVAWFASNCNAANNRLEYAKELAQHIQVDIYGKCGNFTCDKWNQTGCFDMINKDYKFYLSFENSNCQQYITEKLFRNALGYNNLNHLILPIVMGAPKEDYLRFSPPASFIHVEDFESPKELARYLKQLDSDDALYYSYFHWKTLGQFIDTKFMCRVCSLLHDAQATGKRKSYSDIKHWWTTCNVKDVVNGTSTPSGSCCAP